MLTVIVTLLLYAFFKTFALFTISFSYLRFLIVLLLAFTISFYKFPISLLIGMCNVDNEWLPKEYLFCRMGTPSL